MADSTGSSIKKKTLAIDMVMAFLAARMRLMSFFGTIVGVLGLGFGLLTIIRALVLDIPVSGWSSMIVLTSVMGGTILLAIAMLGEYVWRSLDETRGRPIYLELSLISSSGDPTTEPWGMSRNQPDTVGCPKPADELFRFTHAATLPARDVQAPTCPVGAKATWAQIVDAVAGVALFAALLIGALTRDPVSLLGTGLSLIGLAVASWILVGVVKSRSRKGH